MSFIDDLIDIGSDAIDWFTGSSAGANLARTAVTSFALNQVIKSVNNDNAVSTTTNRSTINSTPTVDPGVRLQVDPSPDQKIPVVYGRCGLGGIVVDAVLSDDKQTMRFCIVLCEKTGKLALGAGADSQITVESVYWNNNKIAFRKDGITAAALIDSQTNVEQSTDIDGLVKVWLYNNGSDSPILPFSFQSNALLPSAYSVMSGWNSNDKMSELVFAIVQVTYNKAKNITSLGNMTFVINNTMTLAGDCMYDYMTNKRYGAGIDPSEIYSV